LLYKTKTMKHSDVIKFLTIPFITVLVSNLLPAQTYEKLISNFADELVYDAQFIDSTVCIFPMNTGDHLLDTYRVKFYKMDVQTGTLIDSLLVEPLHQGYYFRGIFDFLKYSDSLFIGIGHFMKVNQVEQLQYIIHLNHNLEMLFDTVVDLPEENELFQKTMLSTDGLIVSVGRDLNNQSNKILCEKTIYGEYLRHKKYVSSGSIMATTVVDLPQRNEYHMFFWGGLPHSFYLLDKTNLDSIGKIEYPPQFLPIDGIANPFDTSFYYVAGKFMMINPSFYLSYLKVSSNGSFDLYTFPNDDNIFYSYKCLSPGHDHLYFGGTYPFTQSPPILYPEQRWILLYKLTHDGEILWQKFYKGDVNYMPIKILATSDGGALVFSTRYDWNDPIPNQRDLHILKIDSTGWYDSITGTGEDLVQHNKQILVYPNPAGHEVNFVLGLYSDLQLHVVNSSGRYVHSQQLKSSQSVDISHLSSGVYFYIITGYNGFKESGKIIKK
jgi:hypothetical protein